MSDAILQAEELTKVYRRGKLQVTALQGVSLQIARGEYLSIMGPSGSGKSTFFNLIGGLDTPTSGRVFLEGDLLTDLNPRQLAWVRCNKVGFIFQSFNLVPTMTALENVTMARIFSGVRPGAARKDAAAMLERVGLAHRLDHLPDEVSGGQQQRIAIARALVNRPSIILADEPTGNLDLRTGEQIIGILEEMKNELNVTIIAATHDMKMLSSSDRVVWINDGRIDRITHKGEVDIRVGTIDGQLLDGTDAGGAT